VVSPGAILVSWDLDGVVLEQESARCGGGFERIE
jgi:hypothetical protein